MEKSQHKKTASSAPMTWYQAFTNTILHPTVSTVDRIITESRVSFWRAFLWMAVAGFVGGFLVGAGDLVWDKTPVTWAAVGKTLLDIPEAIAANAALNLFMAWLIHAIMRLFHKKGSWQSLFVSYTIMTIPYSLLLEVSQIIALVPFARDIIFIQLLLVVFIYFYLTPLVVKANYKIGGFSAFLISIFSSWVVLTPIGIYMLVSMPSIRDGSTNAHPPRFPSWQPNGSPFRLITASPYLPNCIPVRSDVQYPHETFVLLS